jgi:hypothetical protein
MPKIKVFISWSGDQSMALAKSLTRYLPSIVPDAEPFFSSGITGGTMWINEIAEQVKTADYGIICFTNENAKSPWINFEAGALWKGIGGTPVCPILIDTLSDQNGPISIFQSKKFNIDDMRSICQLLGQKTEMDPRRVDINFETFWPKLYQDVQNDMAKVNIGANDQENYGIKITSLKEHGGVHDPIEISGTYERKPPENLIRAIENSIRMHRYWPKQYLTFENKNKIWSATFNIGGNTGEKRMIQIASIGANGKVLLDYSRRVFEDTKQWPGLDTFTADIVILDEISFVRGAN